MVKISKSVNTIIDTTVHGIKALSKDEKAVCSNNPQMLINELESQALSARAAIVKRTITANDIINKHSDIINKSEFSKNISKFLNNHENSPEILEDFNDLIQMVKDKAISIKIFKDIKEDSVIPKAVSEDLAILRKCKNIKPIDAFVPEIKTQEEALKNCKVGDVCHIGNNKYIHIKTADDKMEPLNINKETYFRLFPPVTRYVNLQNNLGNCYEITALNSVMANPQTRFNLLKSFEQSGKDIIIKFPNRSIADGIKIPQGELPKSKNKNLNENINLYSIGSEGMQLAEYAFGKELEHDFLQHQIKNSNDKCLAGKINSYIKNENYTGLAKFFGAKNERTLANNLREGNFATVVWSKLGFKENGFVYLKPIKKECNKENAISDWSYLEKFFTGKDIEDENIFFDKITSKEFFDKHLVECSVLSEEPSSKFTKNHSMRLTPICGKQNNITEYLITDPYNLTSTKIPSDEILNVIDTITFAKI